jgi:hypothetical protein
MIYIILIHEMDFYYKSNEEFKSENSRFIVKKEMINNAVYFSSLSNPEECIRIHSPTPLLDEYEPSQVEDIIDKCDNLMCSNLEYKNRDFLHQALQIITDNFNCYIDNDFGTLLSGADFMRKWNSNPSWNWSNDLDHSS